MTDISMELENAKKLKEGRAMSIPLTGKEMPVGMTVSTDDGMNKAMIIGLDDGKVCLSCTVLGGKVDKISPQQLLDDWVFETPQGLMLCGAQPKSDIITPENGGFQML